MILEYLPHLPNLTDYLLNFDLFSLTNWTALNITEWNHLEFTPFQFDILKLFSAIFCIITALIVVFWIKYGEVISERFIQPSK